MSTSMSTVAKQRLGKELLTLNIENRLNQFKNQFRTSQETHFHEKHKPGNVVHGRNNC
jgi:hypothetical protein